MEDMTKATVLVVDDDPVIVDTLREALEDEGYRVVAAVGGRALPVARRVQPNLILLDIIMPGMNGIEVSARLRKDPATTRIPIVVMSASRNLRSMAAQMPVDDVLAKPFDLDGLYGMVERWAKAG